MKRWSIVAVLLCLGAVSVFSGCSCGKEKQSRTTTKTQVEGQSYLLSSDDFDLETIMALMKEDKVKSAEELEKVINEDSGVNNVDIDKDGKIDFISVKEGREGDALLLDFVAIPSSTEKEDESETVASVKFRRDTATNEVMVEGGYPNYVNGHRDHYYSYHHRHGLSMGEAMFLAWMFTPSRPLFYRPYTMGYYSPRPVYSRSSLASTRTSYRSTTKVSPVKKSAAPSGFGASSAQKSPSKWRQQATKSGGTLSSKSGAAKAFSTRDSSTTKKTATGFGASKSSSGSAWGSSSKSTSGGGSVWGGKPSSTSSSKGSSSSGSSRSGFGSSSGSRKSSGWGSSSGSSRGSSSSRSRSSGSRRRR